MAKDGKRKDETESEFRKRVKILIKPNGPKVIKKKPTKKKPKKY